MNLAYKWQVPSIDESLPYLFITRHAHEARGAVVMYQLTGDKVLETKVVSFIKELVHPTKGYLCLPRACSQELVHEGESFKSVAIAYDLVYHSEILTEEDHNNIEKVLRKFIGIIDKQLSKCIFCRY